MDEVICEKCGLLMHLYQVGVLVRWDNGHTIAGDKYTCDGCFCKVVVVQKETKGENHPHKRLGLPYVDATGRMIP